MSPWEQILYNIVGGALVALLTLLFLGLSRKYHKWTFKGVFGRDSVDSFFIVYGLMRRRPSFTEKGEPMRWPYYKAGTDKAFNVSSIVSFAETKSAKYLSEAFGEVVGAAPKLISDYEIKEKLDISFCSIGGFNNSKTVDILRCDENTLFGKLSGMIFMIRA